MAMRIMINPYQIRVFAIQRKPHPLIGQVQMMDDWLRITEVKHGQKRQQGNFTFVIYQVEDEPGMNYMVAFPGHLPDNAELLRKTERKHLNKGVRK